MGVLTDIVVAASSQASEVLASNVPSDDFPGFDAKGLDQIMLATLWAFLTRTAYDPKWVTEMPLVAGDEEEGPWVFQIPSPMTERLGALPETEWKHIADQWGQTEEMVGVPPENIAALLENLVRFARQATAEQKHLLMWMSL